MGYVRCIAAYLLIVLAHPGSVIAQENRFNVADLLEAIGEENVELNIHRVIPGRDFSAGLLEQLDWIGFKDEALELKAIYHDLPAVAIADPNSCDADAVAHVTDGYSADDIDPTGGLDAAINILISVAAFEAILSPDAREDQEYLDWLTHWVSGAESYFVWGTSGRRDVWEVKLDLAVSFAHLTLSLYDVGLARYPVYPIGGVTCGGGGMYRNIVVRTEPEGLHVFLIGEFWFRLCQIAGHDPWSLVGCQGWFNAALGSEALGSEALSLVGQYRYVVRHGSEVLQVGGIDVPAGDGEAAATEFYTFRI